MLFKLALFNNTRSSFFLELRIHPQNYQEILADNMADQGPLTDEDLVAELREFGENISLPIKTVNKRQILVKKLNHLKARARQEEASVPKSKKNASRISTPLTLDVARTSRSLKTDDRGEISVSTFRDGPRPSVSTRSSGRYSSNRSQSDRQMLDTFSSDDSDTEPLPYQNSPGSAVYSTKSSSRNSGSFLKPSPPDKKRGSQYSDNVLRTIRRRTGEPAASRQSAKTSYQVFELSADDEDQNFNHSHSGKDNNFVDLDVTDHDEPVPSPARSGLYPNLSSFKSYLPNSRNREPENHFESSDPDSDDASTYEVENKSCNTSFPMMGNSSLRTPSSRSPHSSTQQILTASRSQRSSAQQILSVTPRRKTVGRVQQYKSAMTDNLPHIMIAIAAIFFILLTFTYAVNHKDLIFSWLGPSNIGKY